MSIETIADKILLKFKQYNYFTLNKDTDNLHDK